MVPLLALEPPLWAQLWSYRRELGLPRFPRFTPQHTYLRYLIYRQSPATLFARSQSWNWELILDHLTICPTQIIPRFSFICHSQWQLLVSRILLDLLHLPPTPGHFPSSTFHTTRLHLCDTVLYLFPSENNFPSPSSASSSDDFLAVRLASQICCIYFSLFLDFSYFTHFSYYPTPPIRRSPTSTLLSGLLHLKDFPSQQCRWITFVSPIISRGRFAVCPGTNTPTGMVNLGSHVP